MDVGRAAVGGIAIVLLAMMLDRITQNLAQPTVRKRKSLFKRLLNPNPVNA